MRWSMVLVLLQIVGSGCDDTRDIVESTPHVLTGTILDSETALPVEGVQVLRFVRTGSGDADFEFEEQGTTNDRGEYEVILGVSLIDSRFLFRKTGYEDREFRVPEEATEIGSHRFSLDATLVPQVP